MGNESFQDKSKALLYPDISTFSTLTHDRRIIGCMRHTPSKDYNNLVLKRGVKRPHSAVKRLIVLKYLLDALPGA
jgi:hypothetical protein